MSGNAEENSLELEHPEAERYCGNLLRKFHGFWYLDILISGTTAAHQIFTPRASDILLSSMPKSGSTWLKALLFALVERHRHPPADPNHPLLFKHPRQNIHLLEEMCQPGDCSKLDALPSPRVIAMHMPYHHLPRSVTDNSNCKIVYICRNPKDTLVSGWHFMKAMTNMAEGDDTEPIPFDTAFDKCCNGVMLFGPIWDHWLSYWNESLKSPSKVLFLKYEDMIDDAATNVKRLAEFIGCPFSKEEEKDGIIDDIVRLCSFENLSGLEINQTGEFVVKNTKLKYSSYFRKGKVGDWKNYFTEEMAEKLDRIIEEKLSGSGLVFSY